MKQYMVITLALFSFSSHCSEERQTFDPREADIGVAGSLMTPEEHALMGNDSSTLSDIMDSKLGQQASAIASKAKDFFGENLRIIFKQDIPSKQIVPTKEIETTTITRTSSVSESNQDNTNLLPNSDQTPNSDDKNIESVSNNIVQFFNTASLPYLATTGTSGIIGAFGFYKLGSFLLKKYNVPSRNKTSKAARAILPVVGAIVTVLAADKAFTHFAS